MGSVINTRVPGFYSFWLFSIQSRIDPHRFNLTKQNALCSQNLIHDRFQSRASRGIAFVNQFLNPPDFQKA